MYEQSKCNRKPVLFWELCMDHQQRTQIKIAGGTDTEGIIGFRKRSQKK